MTHWCKRILLGLVMGAILIPAVRAEAPAATEWVWLVSVYDEVLENRATRLARKYAGPLSLEPGQTVSARRWLGIDPWVLGAAADTGGVSPSFCQEVARDELRTIKLRLDDAVGLAFRRWIDGEVLEDVDRKDEIFKQLLEDLRRLDARRPALMSHDFAPRARLAGQEAIGDAIRAWVPPRLEAAPPAAPATAALAALDRVWDRLTAGAGATPAATGSLAALLEGSVDVTVVTSTSAPARASARRYPGGLADVLASFRDLEALPPACAAPPGALRVAVLRRGDRNVLEVTSPSLLALEKDGPGDLLFYTLLRAPHPGGPFSAPPGGGHLVARGDPLVPEAAILAGKAGRVAPDRFWLLDPSPGGGPGLDHYVVTEQWCRGSVNQPAGEPSASPVTRPGEPLPVHHDAVANEERLLEGEIRPRYENQWVVIDLALSWPDQAHAVPGMHVVARRGAWVGHFWSGARDETGDRTRDTRGPGWCRVRVPHPGGDVTLVMHAPGGHIERTVKVATPEGEGAGAASEALEASTRKVLQETAAGAAKLEEQLAAVEATLAAGTEPPDWSAVHRQYLDRARRIDLGVALERLRQVSAPLAELDFELHRAQVRGAWAGLLEGEKRRFLLLRRSLALEAARRSEYDDLFAWVGMRARSPQDLEHLEEWKRAKHDELAQSLTRCRSAIDGLVFRLSDGELAALAGDEWALRVIGHQAVGLFELRPGMGTQLRLLADRLALLTGDRLEAAGLWRAASDLPPAAHAAGGASTSPGAALPPWWPDGRAARAVDPAGFPGPDTRESWLVRWLESAATR